jgi:polyferredoxin
MRQFLVSGRTQNVVNLVAGSYTLLGIMVLFIAGNVAPMWCGVSTLSTLITFLVYNIWIDAELDKRRRERTF